MQRATQTRLYTDAQTFPDGVNSYLEPQLLKNTQVRWAVNAVCKGGIWQTRPGYKTRLTIDILTEGSPFRAWWLAAGQPAIHPQFMTIFEPTGDVPYLVFGISGSVWSARSRGDYGFDTPQQVFGLSFSQNADQISWAVAIKSSDIINGVPTAVSPRKYLIMQDGVTRAGYFNGSAGGHLNPEKLVSVDSDGNTIYEAGYNQTRIGFWMAWSGNRLFVANGTQVFASDINDPLSFTEEMVLVNVPVINFEDTITGLVDRGTSGLQQSQVWVFTRNSAWTIASGVLRRQPDVVSSSGGATYYSGGWQGTSDFVRKAFSGVGCIAGKSVINHRGILHWYSEDGIVAFDSAGTVVSTQALPPMDTEMQYSKRQQSPDGSMICAGGRDSYAFWSVPVGPTIGGRTYNSQTQVLDKNTVPVQASGGGITAWQGVWTGINPVEWATTAIFGETRTFALSMDSDGVARIWEAFQGNRADNGHPIPWAIETKLHPVTDNPFVNSVFRFVALKVMELRGTLNIRAAWKGLRSHYHDILNTDITAAPGSLFLQTAEFNPIVNSTQHYNFRKQVRTIISENQRGDLDGCDSAGVESEKTDSIDCAFGLLLRFRGVGAILAYRIATDAQADNTEGSVPDAETGLRILPEPQTVCPKTVATSVTPEYALVDDLAEEAFTPISSSFIDEPYSAPIA